VLQWVASHGRVSKVVVNTLSTSASLTRRGVPGRGSSSKPSKPLLKNRDRHFPTVYWSGLSLGRPSFPDLTRLPPRSLARDQFSWHAAQIA
jgi:hypothetical protein